MIILLWNRWRVHRRTRWLLLSAAVIVLDVFVGSALLTWELSYLRELMR